MEVRFTTLKIYGVEIVPYFESPFFVESNFRNGKKLLGYDFFIYIEGNGLLPDMELSVDYSDFVGSEAEKIKEGLFQLSNMERVLSVLGKEDLREDIKIYLEEGKKYINRLPSRAVVGYEFVYD